MQARQPFIEGTSHKDAPPTNRSRWSVYEEDDNYLTLFVAQFKWLRSSIKAPGRTRKLLKRHRSHEKGQVQLSMLPPSRPPLPTNSLLQASTQSSTALFPPRVSIVQAGNDDVRGDGSSASLNPPQNDADEPQTCCLATLDASACLLPAGDSLTAVSAAQYASSCTGKNLSKDVDDVIKEPLQRDRAVRALPIVLKDASAFRDTSWHTCPGRTGNHSCAQCSSVPTTGSPTRGRRPISGDSETLGCCQAPLARPAGMVFEEQQPGSWLFTNDCEEASNSSTDNEGSEGTRGGRRSIDTSLEDEPQSTQRASMEDCLGKCSGELEQFYINECKPKMDNKSFNFASDPSFGGKTSTITDSKLPNPTYHISVTTNFSLPRHGQATYISKVTANDRKEFHDWSCEESEELAWSPALLIPDCYLEKPLAMERIRPSYQERAVTRAYHEIVSQKYTTN